MTPVIVLGAGDTAVGVIHALAKARLKPFLLYFGAGDHAHFSRHVWARMKVPSPIKEADRLLDLLLNTGENWNGSLLIPCDDGSVAFLSEHRKRLQSRYVPAVDDWRIVQRILDKRSLYLQARHVGIPLPVVSFPDSIQGLEHIAEGLDYPCILKPHQSHRFSEVYDRKVFLLNSETELYDRFNDIRTKGLSVMVSEIIPGSDACYFHYRSYVDRQGRVLAEMCTQKLRQYPTGFGVACLSRTVPMMPQIRKLSLRLLESFPYRGISSVEFKRDARDNGFKLMEINVRPVLPERLLVEAGINFPYVAYMDLVKRTQVPKPRYAPEIYWVHSFFELARLAYFRDLTLREFLRPYRKGVVQCVPFRDDPVPFMARGWGYARKVLRLFRKGPGI